MAMRIPGVPANIREQRRGKWDTRLNQWLKEVGMSRAAFCRKVGACDRIVQLWADGCSMPGLVFAYKIEEVTAGQVPVASWLGTEIGRRQWNALNKKISQRAPAAEATDG
jgi:hypothetical protein